MKRIRVRILMQCNTSQQWIEEFIDCVDFWSSSSGYYYIKMENGKGKYFPINNTIIEEI